jgi:dTDP-4-amino-4,6-dideoxygalactose transaminase
MIPMVDLKTQYQTLKSELDERILAALGETRFIFGPNVHAFEKEAAEYLGVKHAISCASGTDALHLALLAAGIGPGDEVITTPFTFIATAEAVCMVGAKPIFVDIDSRTFNLNLDQVELAITNRTKAVIPVHLFGQPVDLPRLKNLCEPKNIAIIEDCAQSFGATIENKQTGSFGLAGCFSFFPSKNLGCFGDGGMVTTNSDDVAETLKMLRNHGSKQRYYHDIIGYNSRLDELQAVILRIKLKHIDQYNNARRRVAHHYSMSLTETTVTPPHEDQTGVHVYHQYTVLTDQRETIMSALQNAEIASAIYYPVPLHQQSVFREACKDVHLPVTEDISQRCLSLPIFPELADASIESIVETIKRAIS